MSTATPTPASQPPAVYVRPDVPGESLGIAAFVCSLIVPLLGAILGHISRSQAKRAGQHPTGLATAAVIIGWAFTALGVLVAVVFSIALAKAGATYPAV